MKKTGSNKSNIQRTKRVPKPPPPVNKKYFILGILAVIIFVAGVSTLVLVYYGEPTVARINGIRISAADVRAHTEMAENIVSWEFWETYPDIWPVNLDMEQSPGVTFARVAREEAARLAAMVKLLEEYVDEHDIPLWGDDMQFLVQSIAVFVANEPELLAEFEPFLPVPPPGADDGEVEVLAAMHILAGFANFDTREEATAFAEEKLARALAGEDFHTLMHTYSQDFGGLMSYPDGYTFEPGVMVPEFTQATQELTIGEISGLVETIHGYHIIKRIEPDLDDVWRHEPPPQPSLEEQLFHAVFLGFEARVEAGNLTFRRGIDRVPIGEGQQALGW